MNIIELAKLLNISTGTVSRALNDRPEVSAKTREIVLAKARELGWSPNPNARRLVTGRNYVIRLEFTDGQSVLSDYFLIDVARAVEAAVAERGYELLLRLTSGRRAASDAIDGQILVVSGDVSVEQIERLTNGGTQPTSIICGPNPPAFPECSYVSVDTIDGVRDAVKLLVDQGHRRIGYLGTGAASHHTRDEFPSIVRAYGADWADDLLADNLSTDTVNVRRDVYDAMFRMLRLPNPPTAIFARTDLLGVAALQAAHSLGRRVPEDVSIIGHDNIELASMASPPLTTVAIDIDEIGRLAVESLLAVVEGEPPSQHKVGGQLVVRESTGSASIN